ncbi:helix-turn-helix domain-containing protein [Antribacter sp. KLBMP9083]|uniref:Helix-turn-helix domain-containing protein n=1 Tax=Antribacter soli TaxID=2910976 RepID=A0AA41QHU3_9MICO|nr:helix-turn-helix transcriptional regulator [Antribacter soli]MCF4123020.1 helix-turn-helix domain-containing protein [Antribacter soli]
MAGIAQRIREARDVHGWSQEELAAHAGVSRPSIARIERGDDVSTATLVKVTQALGLAVGITEVRAEQ